MAEAIRTNADVARRVALLTAASVLLSVVVTGLAVIGYFHFNPQGAARFAEIWRFSIVMGAFVPAVVCPTVALRFTLLMRDLNHARDECERLAQTDQLTGLLNRRGFDQAAERALATPAARNAPVAALMCDLDWFKGVNDRHGHDFGDAALRHVADVLRAQTTHMRAILGRQGGEEFVVLLLGASAGEAAETAERIRAACAARLVTTQAAQTRITMSVGVAATPRLDGPFGKLIAEADAALYRAKGDGRNRVARAEVAEAGAPA